jgi:hypothetical protein
MGRSGKKSHKPWPVALGYATPVLRSLACDAYSLRSCLPSA